MLQEFLWENTTVYRDILALGREEGTQQNIEDIVQARFPNLLASIKEQVNDLEKLRKILLLVSTAQSEEEVTQGLLAL